MEEATEFLDRVKNGGKLPLITSCSPGWIKYCEHYFPDMTENLSSCKSPQQMFGAMYKTYYAEKPDSTRRTSSSSPCIPCTAKKFEVGRDHQNAAGVPDVDVAITTRELARLIEKGRHQFQSPARMRNSTSPSTSAPALAQSSALPAALWKPLSEPRRKSYSASPFRKARFRRRPRHRSHQARHLQARRYGNQGRRRKRHQERQ